MEINFSQASRFGKEYYEKLQKIFDEADKYGTCIEFIQMYIFNIYPHILREAESEEEKAFVRACEQELVACYQKALERNYKSIKEFKEDGSSNYEPIREWTLTLDANGNPKKTSVIAVDQKGYPLYADGCTDMTIRYELQKVWNCQHELNKWLDRSNSDLYKLREAALTLKQKSRLGMADIPSPNYDLGGLVGGQLDAAAWQNYTIESGLYRPTNYDESLDTLLKNIDICIDFYEKAISMVD